MQTHYDLHLPGVVREVEPNGRRGVVHFNNRAGYQGFLSAEIDLAHFPLGVDAILDKKTGNLIQNLAVVVTELVISSTKCSVTAIHVARI